MAAPIYRGGRPFFEPGLRIGPAGDPVVFFSGDGAPVDGTTGDNFAGPGSIYVDFTNANLYVNTGTITASVWKLVTRAA